MDYATLLENVMDVSHVPFTHHNSVGKRENATPVVLEMEGDLAAEGFTGIWKEGPRSGKWLAVHRVRRAHADATHASHGAVHHANGGVRGATTPDGAD